MSNLAAKRQKKEAFPKTWSEMQVRQMKNV